MYLLDLDSDRRTLHAVLFVAVVVDRADERYHIALAKPINDHISVAVPSGAGKEVGFGIFLALTLRAVASDSELAD